VPVAIPTANLLGHTIDWLFEIDFFRHVNASGLKGGARTLEEAAFVAVLWQTPMLLAASLAMAVVTRIDNRLSARATALGFVVAPENDGSDREAASAEDA
jgi:hypothetical protein